MLVGTPFFWASETPPENCMIRNGATFDGTKWPDLAKVLGSTTLPDDRGLFIRGYDPSGTVDNNPGRKFLTYEEGSRMVVSTNNDFCGLHQVSQGGEVTPASVGMDGPANRDEVFPVGYVTGNANQASFLTNALYDIMGVTRPKNRNYLPIIYAGPPAQ